MDAPTDLDGGAPSDDGGAPGDDAGPAPDGGAPDVDAGGPEVDASAPPLGALTILPADHVLTLAAGASTTVDYTVLDGTGADVTSLATFTIADAVLGTFSGRTFTTSTTRGGISIVGATVGARSAETTIEIQRPSDEVILPGAPADAAGRFGGPTSGAAPSWVYPDDATIVPPNLPSLEVHFLPGAGQTLFDLEIVGSATVHVYAPCTAVGGGCTISLDALTFSEAAIAARASGTVTMRIRGTSGAGAPVGVSTPRTLGITRDPLRGGIYYWAAFSGSILRYEFERRGATPELYIGGSVFACVGCHALSRDGSRISVGHFIPGPATTQIRDVETLADVGASFGSNFASFSPDNARLISSDGARLTLIDAATGMPTTGLGAGMIGSMPDWSPDGSRVVFSRPATPPPFGGTPGQNGRADLMTMGWSGSSFAAPTTLLASAGEDNYYPSYSPDGAWVVFNRSPDESYHNIAAHLWAIRADGAGGAVQLRAADGTGDLGNSWPKWAPFSQTYLGEPLMWVTVSSRRDYGLRVRQQTLPPDMRVSQIWMAAFRPGRAPDPSAPAFWMPIQDVGSGNHIAQWTQRVVRHGCRAASDCRTGERCAQGVCIGAMGR
jgi:hypothetical protein